MNKSDQSFNQSELFSVILGDLLARFEPPGVEEWQPELLASTHLSRRNQVEVPHASPDGKVRNERAIKGPRHKIKVWKKNRKCLKVDFMSISECSAMDVAFSWTAGFPNIHETLMVGRTGCLDISSAPKLHPHTHILENFLTAKLEAPPDHDRRLHGPWLCKHHGISLAQINFDNFALRPSGVTFQFHPCLPPPLDRRSQEPDKKLFWQTSRHVFWNGLKLAGKERNWGEISVPSVWKP